MVSKRAGEDLCLRDLVLEAADSAYIDSAVNSSLAVRPQFLSNNHRQGRKVLSAIEAELRQCSSFIFSVAFISMSGVVPLLQTLKELEQKGVPGRILATNYLSFSEPAALRKLADLSNVELRLFDSQGAKAPGFHTKGYLFEYENGSCRAIVGSSNMTGAALSLNKEWNIRIVGLPSGEVFGDIRDEFESMWDAASSLDDVIDAYEVLYREKQQLLKTQQIITFNQAKLEPNAMQLRFIAGLQDILDSHEKRALLISATGTGKTYAAAFALRHMAPKRVLFLAHREQLLRRSMESFRDVLGDKRTLGLLSGNSRDFDTDYLFATMQTMSQERVLKMFDPHTFDVIVIDEVHRAGAQSYQNILGYFEASFCLGMTASPDRPDGFDIYGLFDNNIAYEIRLQNALEENLLCPFHYFGITEMTVNGRLIDDDFSEFSYLISDERVDRIIEQAEYYGYSGGRVKGLVFCRTNSESAMLAEKFCQRGIRALALSGKDSQDQREAAVRRLAANEGDADYANRLEYIFTVDIFNEGVDIPSVNQVIMLRPTESPIVFIQQLGRGLRKADGKEYVVILDFIGNYSNNYMIPLALSGDRSYNKDSIRKYVMEGSRVIPGISTVHFDEMSREMIFRSIDSSSVTLRLLKEKYVNLRHKLGRVPLLQDFLDHAEIDPILLAERKGSYQQFLMEVIHEEGISFSSDELLALRYLSAYVMKGMRPYELLMLKHLLLDGGFDKETLSSDMNEYYSLELNDKEYESAKRVLGMGFAVSQNAKKKYGQLHIIDTATGDDVASAAAFAVLLKRMEFRGAIEDLVAFGLRRYNELCAGSDGPLALYEKYTRRDACQLLGWEHDDSSTIYGYRTKFGTCPIFVTYEKSAGISMSTQYDDKFVDNRFFNWMTRSNLTLESNEVREIVRADKLGIDIHLFIKKHDSEGSDFYYMGKVHPRGWYQDKQRNDDGRELPIVRFRMELEHPVRMICTSI